MDDSSNTEALYFIAENLIQDLLRKYEADVYWIGSVRMEQVFQTQKMIGKT